VVEDKSVPVSPDLERETIRSSGYLFNDKSFHMFPHINFIKPGFLGRLGLFFVCYIFTPISMTYAQVPLSFENCTVSVLNNTAQVEVDGSFTIFNVPADQGLLRVVMTCSEDDGTTLQGASWKGSNLYL